MAALDVGNGPVEGHAVSSMVMLALVKNGSRRAVPHLAFVRKHVVLIPSGFELWPLFFLPLDNKQDSGC